MNALQEYRYPFNSAYEFFAAGYWHNIESLHLFLGWIILIVFCLIVFLRDRSLYVKFTTLYFAAFIFNNYCFSFFGIRIAEFFGILSIAIHFARKKCFYNSKIAYVIIIIAFLTLIHALCISIIYPDIDQTLEQSFLRLVLICKIIVVGLVLMPFDKEFNTLGKLDELIKDIVLLGSISCLLYLFQYFILLSGRLPYGTFLDAGFTGFPTFGSVSIERGHFAKLLIPLFPFFVFRLIHKKKYSEFLLFSFVSIINFSASGQIFFLCYLVVMALFYKNKFFVGKYYFMFVGCIIPIVLTVIIFFNEQFTGVLEKIDTLVLEGDSAGGRGIDILFQYLQKYPLGTSYGGSTLRVVGDLPEINSGIYAFIAQYSFLSVLVIFMFVYINFSIIKSSLKIQKPDIMRPFYAGIFVSTIIYCADILWFTPTIWLSLVLCSSFTRILRAKRRTDNVSLLSKRSVKS